jgi:hypothetical protein
MMKNGYVIYDDVDSKLEILFKNDQYVYIEISDFDDPEHAKVLNLSYADFREFMKDVSRNLFDISLAE